MMICRYCGSKNIKKVGGDNGNPFDRRPVKMICANCGKVICDEQSTLIDVEKLMDEPLLQRVIKIEMRARAFTVERSASISFPYEDGIYSFSRGDYPLSRFSEFKIDGNLLTLDGETFTLKDEPITLMKQYTACGFDLYMWVETVDIKISEIWEVYSLLERDEFK